MWLSYRMCTHYIDDLLPYAPLELGSYWGGSQMFYKLTKEANSVSSIIKIDHHLFAQIPCSQVICT